MYDKKRMMQRLSCFATMIPDFIEELLLKQLDQTRQLLTLRIVVDNLIYCFKEYVSKSNTTFKTRVSPVRLKNKINGISTSVHMVLN